MCLFLNARMLFVLGMRHSVYFCKSCCHYTLTLANAGNALEINMALNGLHEWTGM